ncbi:MAG: hypothetical protein AAGI51_06165 [Pseudomonadota bacterium]
MRYPSRFCRRLTAAASLAAAALLAACGDLSPDDPPPAPDGVTDGLGSGAYVTARDGVAQAVILATGDPYAAGRVTALAAPARSGDRASVAVSPDRFGRYGAVVFFRMFGRDPGPTSITVHHLRDAALTAELSTAAFRARLSRGLTPGVSLPEFDGFSASVCWSQERQIAIRARAEFSEVVGNSWFFWDLVETDGAFRLVESNRRPVTATLEESGFGDVGSVCVYGRHYAGPRQEIARGRLEIDGREVAGAPDVDLASGVVFPEPPP